MVRQLARIFHESSTAAAGEPLWRDLLPTIDSTYCSSTPSSISSPRTAPQRLSDALATNTHQLCGLVSVLLLAACSGAAAQSQFSYTNSQSGAGTIALGYPVPIPVNSTDPVDGFRLYQSLHARAQDLMLISPDLSGEVAGMTTTGREIWSYRLGDPGTLGNEGRPEPVVLIEGGIHAREWQSPEVLMGLIESFFNEDDPAGLDRFLLDEMQLLTIPVLNVDGFIMTQDNPTQVWIGQDPTVPSQWPRDGRMRRKNLRNSDTDFNTVANHLGGVDLNRNNQPYWARSNSSTSNPAGLTYHGIGPASEPEIQALLATAQSAPIGQLRAFVGAHSFSQVLFTITTGNGRRNAIQTALARDFTNHHVSISASTSPPGRNYANRPDSAGAGIGQTSEYFANQVQIPAWTLEIEPLNGGAEYGGFGANHDGFILPESQVRRVREQLAESHRVLLYHAAGPASVRALQLVDVASGEVAYAARWEPLGDARQLVVHSAAALRSGTSYRMLLSFDRPMRDRVNGASAVFPGQPANALLPVVVLVNGSSQFELPVQQGQWLDAPSASGESFLAYREDSFLVEFSLPADFPAGSAQLDIFAADLIGRALDSDPRTPVGWSLGHWTGYEDETGNQGDSGGRDQNFTLDVAPSSEITIESGSRRLLEGGGLDLVFARRGDLSGPAQLNLDFVPVEGIAANVVSLNWAAGEGGSKQIRVSATEDVIAESDYGIEVALSASGASLAADALRLRVVDNDSAAQAVIRLGDTLQDLGDFPANRLAWALSQSSAAQRPLRIELAAEQTVFHPAAGASDQSLQVSGAVTLIGANAELIAVGAQPLLEVAAGSTLLVEDLRLRSASGAILIDNQGSLQLLRSRLQSATGAGLRSNGELSIDRSSLRTAAAAIELAAGSATLSDSTLVANDNESDVRIKVAAGAQFSGAHLTLSAQSNAALGGAGSFSLADSIVLGATPCALSEGAGFSSGGGNLSTAALCDTPAAGDQVVQSIDVGAFDEASGSLPPGPGLSAFTGNRCPNLDQLGAPRGDSCVVGARSLEPAFARGLWWNPQRPGHGQHIEIVDGVAFVLWYTYDLNGQPLTWTAQGELVNGVLQAPLLRWRRQEITRTPVFTEIGSLRLEFSSGSSAQAEWSVPGQGSGIEPLQPFRFTAGEPLQQRSGLYADFNDFGWGLTLQQEGATAFALLYFFAADDQLRWASAQNPGGAGSSLQAFGQTGSCLGCASTASQGYNAGRILLDDRGDGRLDFTGLVSLSVQPGGAWINRTTLDRFARR